jgi:predicted RNase H-like HicB family nuclease
MLKYPIRIFWWEEDQAWVAVCPAFPFVSVLGATRAEVAREMDGLLEELIETCEEEGKPLPPVIPEPVSSGQIRLRLPRTVHDRAIECAQVDETSLNTFLVSAVAQRIGESTALAEMRALREDVVRMLAEQNAAIERLQKA